MTTAVSTYARVEAGVALDTARISLERAWRSLGVMVRECRCDDEDREVLRVERARLLKAIGVL